jgi:hemolysin activation/secretion protein
VLARTLSASFNTPGDHGVGATGEVRYTGIEAAWGVKAVPYGFYDIGIVWNDDSSQAARASGSSGGAGVKVLSDLGITTDFTVAFPLTRDITNPLTGNGRNPRYLMQVSYGF